MANLRKVIYINEEDYSTLINGDSLVIDGTTYTYEENALYVIKNAGPPEYAETAGYATNAGTSQVAVADASGNNIATTYEKKPLIIEVSSSDDGHDLSQGTYDSITLALVQDKLVILKVTLQDGIQYLNLVGEESGHGYYWFASPYSDRDGLSYSAYISDDNNFNYNYYSPAFDSLVVHKSGSETISGNKTFTGTVSLGSKATATTPAATDNDTNVATTAFVKTVVANSINELPSPMIFKGSLGTGGTITTLPAATTSNEGYTYKVITNGTYGGQSAKIGDTFISDGSNWIYIPSGDEPSGTVTNIKIQATSPIAIDDSSAITTSGVRTISHNNSGVTAGTYKSVTVDAKGHVTAGTNPTTLAGYGITDAVTLNTEQTITGLKTFGLYGDERHTYNVCNFYLKTTFKHVVLYTNLPYSSGSFMPVITLKGFLYSTTDLESKITFYIYNNEFYTPKVLHLGAASPIVYLFTYNDNGTERVAVGLEGNFYYLGFQADIHFPALGENYKPKSLWTFNTDNITYDSTTTEENRIIPSIGVNHCVRCGINSLDTTTTGNIAKIGSSTDNAVVRFDGTTSAIQNSGVIIDDNNNLTANSFKKTGGTSSQFLKADGSVDSNTYLTSFTETDPTVPSHVKAITSLNISDWNNKLDEAYYVVNVTSDSQITPPSTVSGTANHYYLDIVTAYNNGKIPIVILNQELILPFITSNQTVVLFGTTVNLYSYLITIDEDSVEIKSLIGISEADIPITQIQINGSALVPDSQIVNITSIPASIVEQNSIYRFVNDSEKSKISSAIQGIKVNGTSITPNSSKVVDITIPDNELSSAYLRSILENEDLLLEAGDSYETAFGKLEKAIIDDEETVAAALNELNDKIKDIDTELDEESENPVQNKAITLAILDNEYVVSVALNNLNDRIQAKLDTLISGTNIKTINGTSILGSGNINVSGGSGTGGGGDENVIETIKVNGTALTPDANKAVNITSIPASIVAQDATHRFVSDTEKTTWNGKQNALLNYIENNGHVDISTYVSEGDIDIVSYDDTGGWAVAEAIFGSNGIELNAKQTFTNGEDEIAHNVTLSSEGFKFDNKQIATTDQIPTKTSDLTNDSGFITDSGVVKTTGDLSISGIKTFSSEVRMTAGGTSDISSGVLASFKTNRAQITNLITHNIYTGGTNSTTPITFYKYGSVSGLAPATLTLLAKIDTDGNIYEGTTKLSDKYLTSYTETDPTVPAWAKAANKPTYTAAEVGALPDTYTPPVTSVNGQTGAVNLTIPSAPGTLNTTATTAQSTNSSEALSGNITLHKVAKTGTYNDLIGKPTIPTVNNATLTIQKNGTTINTFTANASSNVTANIQVNELPTVSSSDNGKILQVVNGAWTLVTPTAIYSGTSTPNNSTGNDGDLYLQTS